MQAGGSSGSGTSGGSAAGGRQARGAGLLAWHWVWSVAVLLAAGLPWLAWRLRPSGVPQESVADMAASDAEVRLPADDRLEFGGLARGVSRFFFLRNSETHPPLTPAVTGDWGTGKSSLIQRVCADLRRFGHRPLWFNAWHHQKQEHLCAALLGAVRAQAVPPLLLCAVAALVSQACAAAACNGSRA